MQVDIDECDELAELYRVESVPTIVVIRPKQLRQSIIVNFLESVEQYKSEIIRNRSSGRLLVFEFYAKHRFGTLLSCICCFKSLILGSTVPLRPSR